jgi:hypothetical protein
MAAFYVGAHALRLKPGGRFQPRAGASQDASRSSFGYGGGCITRRTCHDSKRVYRMKLLISMTSPEPLIAAPMIFCIFMT